MPAKDPSSRIKSALRAYQQATSAIDRLKLSRRLREAAEQLEVDAIDEAREDGATWREIGFCYGLTKQGAQQRFRTIEQDQPAPREKRSARQPGGRSA